MTEHDPRDDIESIRKLKARYFRTIDQQDWDGVRELFSPDAWFDTSTDTGGAPYRGRDRFVAVLEKHLSGVVTTHHGHTAEIELTGPNIARGIWAMEDHLWFPAGHPITSMWGTGWYEEQYERNKGRWRIVSMTLRRQRVEVDGVQIHPKPEPG